MSTKPFMNILDLVVQYVRCVGGLWAVPAPPGRSHNEARQRR